VSVYTPKAVLLKEEEEKEKGRKTNTYPRGSNA
jgi:hypothetical protein